MALDCFFQYVKSWYTRVNSAQPVCWFNSLRERTASCTGVWWQVSSPSAATRSTMVPGISYQMGKTQDLTAIFLLFPFTPCVGGDLQVLKQFKMMWLHTVPDPSGGHATPMATGEPCVSAHTAKPELLMGCVNMPFCRLESFRTCSAYDEMLLMKDNFL